MSDDCRPLFLNMERGIHSFLPLYKSIPYKESDSDRVYYEIQ